MIGVKLCADPKCHCDSRNRQCYCSFLAHNVPKYDLNLRSQNPFEKLTALGQINVLGTFFDHNIPVPDEDDYHTGQKFISPYWHVQGEWVNDLETSEGEFTPALIGEQLAQRTGLKQGDKIQLRYQNNELDNQSAVEITGILSTGGAEDNQLVMPLNAVQKLLSLEGKIQSVKVSALTVPENDLSRKARANTDALDAEEYDRWYCTAYVSSISHQLEEAIGKLARFLETYRQ